MTTIIAGLLDATTWEIIFSSAFFFGLFFFLVVLIGAFGDDDTDVEAEADSLDGDTIDLDGDGIPDGIDLDGDGVIDIEFDSDFDSNFDADFDSSGTAIDLDGDGLPDGIDLDGDGIIDIEFDNDFDVDFDTEVNGIEHGDFERVELPSSADAERSHEQVYQSKYAMGNYSAFLFMFGQIGWFYASELQDQHIIYAMIGGFLAMKLFSLFISNYTKTVVIPLQPIRRGDIARVRYSVSPEKIGMVQIARRDGVISTDMAKGAFPHDHFSSGEKGYIWGKKNGIFLLTKGVQGQPDLQPSDKTKPVKNALDI